MPIKGLTDRQVPTFPLIGSIRKGAKKTEEKKPGPDLTYFRYVPLEEEEEAALKFHQVYGDEPREINIFLPFDEIERNFEAFMERHTASALQCRGDGETAFLWRDEDGVMQHISKPCPLPLCKGCKETGRLKIIIPELRRLAYVVVHTTSVWDIIELTANLEAIRLLTGNGLKGIPLVLKRRPRMVSTPRENGKRVRQEIWLLSIEADPRWMRAQLKAMEIAALPASVSQSTLLEPAVDIITGEILRTEEEAPPPFAEDGGPPSSPSSSAGEPVENGQVERPYTPRYLQSKLIQQAEGKPATHQNAKATPGQRGLVAGKLSECFAPADDADDKRHLVLEWLVGDESTDSLTMAIAGAILDWLLDKDADEGTYDLHPAAPAEAQAVWKAALEEAGQQALPWDEDEEAT